MIRTKISSSSRKRRPVDFSVEVSDSSWKAISRFKYRSYRLIVNKTRKGGKKTDNSSMKNLSFTEYYKTFSS
jgi:hypothetical protein